MQEAQFVMVRTIHAALVIMKRPSTRVEEGTEAQRHEGKIKVLRPQVKPQMHNKTRMCDTIYEQFFKSFTSDKFSHLQSLIHIVFLIIHSDWHWKDTPLSFSSILLQYVFTKTFQYKYNFYIWDFLVDCMYAFKSWSERSVSVTLFPASQFRQPPNWLTWCKLNRCSYPMVPVLKCAVILVGVIIMIVCISGWVNLLA